MTEQLDPGDAALPDRGRWIIVAGLSLLALPVTFSFFFFGLVAATGAPGGGTAAAPQPLLAVALGFGAATMGAGWAGLVPWAMGRPDRILTTCGLALVLVSGLFSLLAF